MKINVICSSALLILWSGVAASQPVTLTEDQIRLIMENMTIEGTDLQKSKGDRFERFFDADGTVTEKRIGADRTGRWWVNEKGQHCVEWKSDPVPLCHYIEKDDSGIRKYSWKPGKKKNFAIEYDGFSTGEQK